MKQQRRKRQTVGGKIVERKEKRDDVEAEVEQIAAIIVSLVYS